MPSPSPASRPDRAGRPRRGVRPRRDLAACAAVAILALAGCGGGGTETVVRTVTVPVGGDTGAGTSTDPAPPTTAAPATASGAPEQALPDGRPAIDGLYRMSIDDYTPPQITIGADGGSAEDLPWNAETTCDAAGACTLELRRGLQGGAFKNLTLTPDGDDDRTWSVQTSGKSSCGATDTPAAPYRLSVRATEVADVEGRPTATELVSYLRADRVPGCTYGDDGGRTTYRGSRDAG